MDIINLIIAFNLGLFSSVHCLGMCGGIIGALALGVKQEAQDDALGKFRFSLAYNTGRICSYSVAGAIAGYAGQQVITGIMPESGHMLLQILAAVFLVIIGLHLAGWLPKFQQIEVIGMRIWKYLQPLSRHFLPVVNPGQAFVIGMIWGWLPCALVYSVLLWSMTAGDAYTGSILMMSFGLGTLPGMVTAGIIGGRLQQVLKHKSVRSWAGIIIVIFGVTSPFMQLYLHDSKHTHHQQHHISG